MLPLKPPYNRLYFINILLSPNICAFWDMETFLHSQPIFSTLPNLTFMTSETQIFKFDIFLPCILSPTQNEPKEPNRSQINPHLDHETAVDILLEEAAWRCFDLAHTDLAHLSPNRATHLKSPKKSLEWLTQSNDQRKSLFRHCFFWKPETSSVGLLRYVWYQFEFNALCEFCVPNNAWHFERRKWKIVVFFNAKWQI